MPKILLRDYESKWAWYSEMFEKVEEVMGDEIVVDERELSCLEVLSD